MVVIKALIIVTLILTINGQPKARPQKGKNQQAIKNNDKDEKEQQCLEDFFDKYCKEKNEKILKQLEKCEMDHQPENVRHLFSIVLIICLI